MVARDQARARKVLEALNASAAGHGLAELGEAADRLEAALPGVMGDQGYGMRGALASLGPLVDQLRATCPFRASSAVGSR